MIRRSLLILVVMCCSLLACAIPAKHFTFTHRQSNGTVLTLKLVGDECGHYYVNVATGGMMQKADNGDFYQLSDSVANALIDKAMLRRSQINQVRRQRLERRRATSTNGARRVGTANNVTSGSRKGLVILVNYTDTMMTHTAAELDDQFNMEGYSQGGHVGSVHDYFYDQSYGAFDITFDVVGPVTVSQKMSYYGSNNDKGRDKHPAEMVIEACKLADAEGVDFSQYDWDGDGEVDQVYIIYAGYGESYGASQNTIWPHEWDLASAGKSGDGTGTLTLDGVKINTYACSCELAWTSGTTLNGIGTACHEFSHCLGLPDFYDTTYTGGFGMNVWDLMDAGSYNGPTGCGEVPAGYTSYERWSAGWLTPTELKDPVTVTDMASLNDAPEAYIIYNDKNSNEYILFENRQNEKWFKYVSIYNSPHGLLAIHVDYNATAWENDEANNTASHQRMSIIPSSGEYGSKFQSSGRTYYSCSSSQLDGHPFGGSSSIDALTATSHKSSGGKWFTACSTGSTDFNHEVTDITNADDGTISFNFDTHAYTLTLSPCGGTCDTEKFTQSNYGEAITLPACVPPSSDVTFLGWTTKEVIDVASTKPTTLYAAGSTYSPTADLVLYAVYSTQTNNMVDVPGFKLRIWHQNKAKTQYQHFYISAGNAGKERFETSAEYALTLFYLDGNLWYNNGGMATYAYCQTGTGSQKYTNKIEFTTDMSKASEKWVMTEKDSTATFTTQDGTYALAMSVLNNYFGYVRAYSTSNNNQNKWTISYTGETFPLPCSGTTYSSYPVADVAAIERYGEKLTSKGIGTITNLCRLINRAQKK